MCNRGAVAAIAALLLSRGLATAQEQDDRPVLRAGRLSPDFLLDGRLDEPAWRDADAIRHLSMVDPLEGEEPSEPTTVQVLVDPKTVVIGIRCHDSRPEEIVSRSMDRDAPMEGEDRVVVLLDTFLDERTGYVFTVNPEGARRDSLVSRRGEREDARWDGLWEARTSRDAGGWSVEIRIPILTLSFREGLGTWGFNVERHLMRTPEILRWASPRRDFKVTQAGRAGLLSELPEFALGIGLSVQPSAVAGYGRLEVGKKPAADTEASLDVTQRLAPALLASLTVNTDFSETEVDARQTNLTRFPLFFPEKRSFFLEGADLFEFGLGLSEMRSVDLLPFHSRRIGLVDEQEVPLELGGKVTGRAADTSIGALGVRMGEEEGVAPETTMGVLRLKQDILEESSVGMIATAGDPLDRDRSWLVGGDATYQTSRFLGDKNLLAGLWAIAMHTDDTLGHGAGAYGGKIDYPNDVLDLSFTAKRIGKEFDPPLGFVSRNEVHKYDGNAEVKVRPGIPWVRRLETSGFGSLWTGLDGHWESYRTHVAPLDLESDDGDQFGVHFVWEGDRPVEAFEVAPGVSVPPGTYHGYRYHPHLRTAGQRWWSAEVRYDLGEYYDGRLTSLIGSLAVNPHSLVTLSGQGERHVGEVPAGDFRRELVSARLRLNLTPDFNLSTFVQFDSDSRDLGSFARVRWQVTPESELFLVYQHGWQESGGELRTETYEGTLKVQYILRF
jgi:hypothetical protein